MSSHSTKLTHWPESMSDLPAMFSANPTAETEADLAAVIAQIEQSLRISRQALLQRDLARFEEETAVQSNLCRILVRCARDRTSELSETRDACCRILQLGRVHLGVLRRAERSARVLSHLLASPGCGYPNAAAGLPVTANRLGCSREV